MTQDPVHFVSCDVCNAVSMQLGVAGSDISGCVRLAPDDPRARLLCQITDVDNQTWGKPMGAPARVVGMVNVHGAAKMSEVGSTCFHCGAGPQ